MKILVTGADGQLGNCLRELEQSSKHKFIFTDIAELDITSKRAVNNVLQAEKPDWVINCAAYNGVDKAEEEQEIAEKINSTAVKILTEETGKIGAGIIHISTDYIFDGSNPSPLTEDEPTAPLSVYGKTKLMGEKEAEKNEKHIIIRTSWLYSIYGNNFVKTMIKLGKEKSEINVVSDQWGSPTSAHELAKVILIAIDKKRYGTYNYSNEGTTSWAIFAEEVMNFSGSRCKINHISTDEYNATAKRPQFSILSKKKITKELGIKIPEWEASLEEIIERILS